MECSACPIFSRGHGRDEDRRCVWRYRRLRVRCRCEYRPLPAVLRPPFFNAAGRPACPALWHRSLNLLLSAMTLRNQRGMACAASTETGMRKRCTTTSTRLPSLDRTVEVQRGTAPRSSLSMIASRSGAAPLSPRCPRHMAPGPASPSLAQVWQDRFCSPVHVAYQYCGGRS